MTCSPVPSHPPALAALALAAAVLWLGCPPASAQEWQIGPRPEDSTATAQMWMTPAPALGTTSPGWNGPWGCAVPGWSGGWRYWAPTVAETAAPTARVWWEIRGLQKYATYQVQPNIDTCDSSTFRAIYWIDDVCVNRSTFFDQHCDTADGVEPAWSGNRVVQELNQEQTSGYWADWPAVQVRSDCGCLTVRLSNAGYAGRRVGASSVRVVLVDPAPDGDGDGVPDPEDRCPSVPGASPSGCPPDADGDGIPDDQDLCPQQAGPSPDGCPASGPTDPGPPDFPPDPGLPPFPSLEGDGGSLPGIDGPLPGSATAARPVIRSFSASSSRLAIGGARIRGAASRIRFAYRVSIPSTVRIALERRIRGRRRGVACVAAPPRQPGAACWRWQPALTLTGPRTAATRGSIVLSGTAVRRRLGPRAYRATIVATSSRGARSAPRSLAFSVVGRRPEGPGRIR